jgi:DNA polymerase
LPFDDVGDLPPDLFQDEVQPVAPPNPIAAMDWPALKEAVAGCRACGLCERRTNTVFGVGDRNAAVMFIGEGPGADEDRQGEPFVGRAGQLLNRMLAAAGFTRQQVYIANIVKCRPPNNRDPSVDEAAACRAYLARQIALVQPRLIVCLGRVPAHNLLGTTESIGRLRGRLHQYGPARVPLLVTYHPSYYLRSPQEKAKGWQDLQRMLAFLE